MCECRRYSREAYQISQEKNSLTKSMSKTDPLHLVQQADHTNPFQILFQKSRFCMHDFTISQRRSWNTFRINVTHERWAHIWFQIYTWERSCQSRIRKMDFETAAQKETESEHPNPQNKRFSSPFSPLREAISESDNLDCFFNEIDRFRIRSKSPWLIPFRFANDDVFEKQTNRVKDPTTKNILTIQHIVALIERKPTIDLAPSKNKRIHHKFISPRNFVRKEWKPRWIKQATAWHQPLKW